MDFLPYSVAALVVGAFYANSKWRAKEDEAIDIDIQEQSRELLHLRRRIDREEDEIQSNNTKNLALKSRMQELRTDHDNAQRDAAATEGYTTENGRMERQELIDEFSKLRQAIDHLQSCCEGYIGPEKKLSKDQARAILKHLGGEENRQDDVKFVELAMDRSPPLRPIVGCLLRHYLDSALLTHVFWTFVPGNSTGFLSKWCSLVQKGLESQSRSVQWRYLTYKYAVDMREENWSAEPAAQFTQELKSLLHAVGQGQSALHAVEAANQITTQIFEAAVQFKDRAILRCHKFDFHVYTTSDDGKLYPKILSEAHPNRWISSSRVILGVGLGLRICERIQLDSNTIQRDEHPVRASVIGDSSWLLSYQLWGPGSRDRYL